MNHALSIGRRGGVAPIGPAALLTNTAHSRPRLRPRQSGGSAGRGDGAASQWRRGGAAGRYVAGGALGGAGRGGAGAHSAAAAAAAAAFMS